jgi:hypothetical protein
MPNLNKNICSAAILLQSIALIGCASITGTTSQNVSVQTKEPIGDEVRGASCELTNSKGKWFVVTPGTVGINRSNDNMLVLCRKDGYETGRGTFVSDTKGMMFGNIIFGGAVGAVIDHSSGAAYEYPSLFQIMMTRSVTEKQSLTGVQPNSSGLPQPSTQRATTDDLEKKLAELKDLFDRNLISRDIYIERQRKLLQQ